MILSVDRVDMTGEKHAKHTYNVLKTLHIFSIIDSLLLLIARNMVKNRIFLGDILG